MKILTPNFTSLSKSSKINLECLYCEKVFEAPKYLVDYTLKTPARRGRLCFCSSKCSSNSRKTSKEVLCTHCKKSFTKRQKEIKKSPNNFCSSSCSASYNNALNPKKKRSQVKCKYCDTLIEKTLKRTLCSSCTQKKPELIIPTLTKKELFIRRSSWQSARSAIRRHAEKVFAENNPNTSCPNCNYSKHLEVAHIKSVSSFSDEDLISDINKRENLIGLCRNCHWEFDNGLLKLE